MRPSPFVLSPLLLILAACGSPRPAALPPEEPQTVEQVEAIPMDARESALRELTESQDPETRRRALASLAIFFKEKGRLEEAEKAFGAAAAANELIRSHLTLQIAEVRAARGDLPGAAAALRSVATADSGIVGSIARLRLAGILARAGDADGARAEIRTLGALPLDELNDEEFARLADALS
ncbi:MAG TPA: tetratricopeptide repeat protein, partial [Thermoanaerobaculia bacterium]|nr:tetratricopeptide repeat protein [Thermoanaerobaculia bacterium]